MKLKSDRMKLLPKKWLLKVAALSLSMAAFVGCSENTTQTSNKFTIT
jgi:hypothetical protein